MHLKSIFTNNQVRAKTAKDNIYGGKQMDNMEARNGMVSKTMGNFAYSF